MDNFIKQYQKVPVEIYPNSVTEDPYVSVIVQTYMHVDYIAECLDGILMQRTDFSFEILVGEDESKDGTRDICIKYAEKNADKIRLFLHSRENTLHIENNPTGRFNLIWNLTHAKGKYIAFCEGDDYWTDSYKLQKQVDFMDANREYDLCYTDVNFYYQKENKIDKAVIISKPQDFPVYSNVKLFLEREGYVAPCTWLFRKECLNYFSLNSEFSDGTYAMIMDVLANSKIYFLPEVTAIYRLLEESASHSSSLIKRYNRFLGLFKTQKYYIKKYALPLKLKIKMTYRFYKRVAALVLKNTESSEIDKLLELIKKDNRNIFLYIIIGIGIIIRMVKRVFG